MMDEVRCEITDAVQTDGVWFYAWEQREANYDTGADQKPLAFAGGTTEVNPAVEVNNTAVPIGTIAFIRPRGFVQGQLWFEFAHEEGGSAIENDQVTLGSQYTIMADNTVEFIPAFELEIPSDGEYLIWAQAIASVQVSSLGSGAPCAIAFELYKNGATQTNVAGPIAAAPIVSMTFDGMAHSQRLYPGFPFTAGDVLTMGVQRRANTGGVFSVATINTSWRGLLGETRMAYAKVLHS